MMEPSTRMVSAERRRAILVTLVMLLPLGLSAFFIYGVRSSPISNGSTTPQKKSTQSIGDGRLVMIIVDSLRRQAVDELMPNLKALAQQRTSTYLDIHTAGGNMSLPCIQTLMHGRQSPYATRIHTCTVVHSPNISL